MAKGTRSKKETKEEYAKTCCTLKLLHKQDSDWRKK
jgi:hypothetical protein